jgi:hypothetical protein
VTLTGSEHPPVRPSKRPALSACRRRKPTDRRTLAAASRSQRRRKRRRSICNGPNLREPIGPDPRSPRRTHPRSRWSASNAKTVYSGPVQCCQSWWRTLVIWSSTFRRLLDSVRRAGARVVHVTYEDALGGKQVGTGKSQHATPSRTGEASRYPGNKSSTPGLSYG